MTAVPNRTLKWFGWFVSVYDWKENEIPDRYVRIVETQYAVVKENSTSVRLIFVLFCSFSCHFGVVPIVLQVA